jgi:thimet oligopeptidase
MSAADLFVQGPEAFSRESAADLDRARAAVARLKSQPPSLETLRAWDEASLALSNASARASLLRSVHPDAAMRDTGERCEQEVEAYATSLALDPEVYAPLSKLDASKEDEATRFYVFRTLRDFRRAGVDKDPATRERVRLLNEELVKIGQEFQRNIRDDVRKVSVPPAELEGLPDDYVRAHPPEGGQVSITTDYPDYVPFMTYARSSKAREALWKVYRQRAHPKNLEVLSRMLARRHELARILGYPSWAAYVTEDKMIGSDKAASQFIEKIAAAAEARAAKDYGVLLDRKRRDDPMAMAVDAWDSEQLKERVRAEQLDFDSQSVRPYFEFNAVVDGILRTCEQLFGIEIRLVRDARVWHEDVTAWEVLEKGALLGRFFLDLHPREGKYKHAAQFTLASGVAGRALPEAALVCNFVKPGRDEPALLEHSEVVTFFHEFGHLLHHLFGGRTRWAGLSGVRTEWDFVEAPSQMLEEWCWDAKVLQRFARHYKTGEPIPEALVQRMREADEFGKGLRVRQQMFYAATSLRFHDRDPEGLDTTRLSGELQERYTPFRHVDGTYFQESFGHLEGYSAIYYTYMWSLVIAKDLFGVFRREGLLERAPAARYRKAVLEPGGSRPANELVRDFLGRDSSFDAFAAWLNRN